MIIVDLADEILATFALFVVEDAGCHKPFVNGLNAVILGVNEDVVPFLVEAGELVELPLFLRKEILRRNLGHKLLNAVDVGEDETLVARLMERETIAVAVENTTDALGKAVEAIFALVGMLADVIEIQRAVVGQNLVDVHHAVLQLTVREWVFGTNFNNHVVHNSIVLMVNKILIMEARSSDYGPVLAFRTKTVLLRTSQSKTSGACGIHVREL